MTFLKVKDLTLTYSGDKGLVPAVNRVSFSIEKPGQALAVVGESGCGKTSLSLAILRRLPHNVAEHSGRVLLEGKDIMRLSENELRKTVSWKEISWVPQNPMAVFNPVYRIGKQIEETLYVHDKMEGENPLFKRFVRGKERKKGYREETIRLLKQAGLRADDADKYPHQFSGGMLQRAAIATALALNPKLMLLDEPTSALDVSIQGEIINLLNDLKARLNLSYIFITHNIVLATKLCESFAVIYAGRIVEQGPTKEIVNAPLHPYTKKLLKCVPSFEDLTDGKEIASIPGEPPDLSETIQGCPFAERPAVRCARCSETEMPPLTERRPEHFVACHGV